VAMQRLIDLHGHGMLECLELGGIALARIRSVLCFKECLAIVVQKALAFY